MTRNSSPSPREFLQRLVRDKRGATVVFVALASTVLIGFVGLGVEAGMWYAVKRQDQSAADAAAISGAYELAAEQGQSGLYSDICKLAQRDAASNGFTFQSYSCPTSSPGCTNPSSGQMCVNNPPVSSTTLNGDNTAVEVILNRQENTLLANLFLANVTIGSHAVAKVNLPGYTCDLSLAKTGTGISVQGSGTLNLTGCGMAANSSDAAAISFGGGNNDILDAAWFQTVGNYNASGNPVLNVTTKLTNSTPVTDPYSCNPPQLGCAGKILYSDQSGTTPISVAGQSNPPCYADTGTPTTLVPGLYGQSNGNNCSAGKGNSFPPMQFTSSTGTTTLCPGVYYLDGDDGHGSAFAVKGGTVNLGTAGATSNGVTCPSNGMNGVTIIALSLNGVNKGGGFTFQNGIVSLSAPTARNPSGCTLGSTGCIPSGVLFYQDPNDADTSKQGSGLTADSTMTAGTGTSMQGVFYTPATNVTFTGNAGSACFIVISLTMTYTGNSTMSGNEAACQAVGVTGPTVMNVTLAE